MSTDARSRRRAGQASVEAVLVLPFLVFLIVAANFITLAMIHKLDVVVATRTFAWNDSFRDYCFASPSNVAGTTPPFGPFCEDDRSGREGDGGERRGNWGERWMRDMFAEGRRASREAPVLRWLPSFVSGVFGADATRPDLIREVRRAESPLTSTATVTTWFSGVALSTMKASRSRSGFRAQFLPVWFDNESHQVSLNRRPSKYWNPEASDDRRVLELGYDRVLQDKLCGGVGFGSRSWARRTDLLMRDLFPALRGRRCNPG